MDSLPRRCSHRGLNQAQDCTECTDEDLAWGNANPNPNPPTSVCVVLCTYHPSIHPTSPQPARLHRTASPHLSLTASPPCLSPDHAASRRPGYLRASAVCSQSVSQLVPTTNHRQTPPSISLVITSNNNNNNTAKMHGSSCPKCGAASGESKTCGSCGANCPN
ncbi:hypothetical protein BT67DRAFT_256164 [Trichocladium antarcticum]|uniref:Uncharacterized protein n=1 Tax=Trichocladium antarcticum TaxID=1450529 RepID=A0AAN6ZFB7_9PEZI|nr:hypothetical protein BT67DRAFT_256164 [Trichocladium antarcticum]